jgi:hypothetical protein
VSVLRRAAGAVVRPVRRVRHAVGVAVGTALGLVGLLLGVATLWFAVTAPATGCVLAGGDCLLDAVTAVDGAVRWLGTLVLLYGGASTLVRARR